MQVWPFKPVLSMTEVLQWRTDVIKTKNAEQRFSLREYPERNFNFNHVLSEAQYQAARAMVFESEEFLVPSWQLSIELSSLSAGASVSVSFSEELNLEADDEVLIWSNVYDFEVCTVESADSNGVVLTSVANDWGKVQLVPLSDGITIEGLQVSRPAGKHINASINFDLRDNKDLQFDQLYSQYRGHDVIQECAIAGSSSFDESTRWEGQIIDNFISDKLFVRARAYPDNNFNMRWHKFTTPDINDVLYWIHSRRGRWKAFWLSSYGRDLDIATNITAVATSITVFALPGLSDIGGDEDFDIDLSAGEQNYYRRVQSVTAGSQVNGRDTLILGIDSSLGVAYDTDQVARISFMRCVRFNADRVEIEHRAGSGAQISIPCVEVPVP